MLWITQGWLIYELSGSAILLGVAGLARALPSTVLTFIGGAMADRLDQRRVLIAVQAVQMLLLGSLATLTVSGQVEVWHLILIISASSGAQSIEGPARQAIFPRLIPRTALMDAVALNSTVHPGTRFLAPLLAGLVMAQARILTGDALLGAAILFYFTAAGYVVNAGFLHAIRLETVVREARRTSVAHDMREGVQFVIQNRIFGSLILMTYCGQFFGWSMQSLFPIFAKDIFNGGAFELGLLYSTLGAGSLIGAAAAANLAGVRGRGRLIAWCFLVQALLLGLFAVTPVFAIALMLLILLGVAQSIFNVTAQSTLQYMVPSDYRGRVMGIWGMTHTAVQPVGQFQMGAIAGFASAEVAVAVGSIAMIGFALLVVFPNGRLRALQLKPPEGAEEAESDQARLRAHR